MLAKNRRFADLQFIKNEVILFLYHHYRTFWISGAVFCLWTCFSILSRKNFYERQAAVSFCRLDGYVVMDSITIKALVLFPVAVYFFSVCLNSTSLQMIIRKCSRKEVFGMLERVVIILAFYLTVIIVASSFVTGLAFCENGCNWTQTGSVFWYEMEQTAGNVPGDVRVMLLAGLSGMLDYSLFGYVYLLVGYCCDQKYLAYLLEVGIALCLFGFRDFIPFDGIGYPQWICWNWLPYIWKIIGILGLRGICCRWITKKDFLGGGL